MISDPGLLPDLSDFLTTGHCVVQRVSDRELDIRLDGLGSEAYTEMLFTLGAWRTTYPDVDLWVRSD